MKKFLVIISFISILFSQDWQWMEPKPFGIQMYDMYFMNPDTGWAVGDVGWVIRTYDGGKNWDRIKTGTDERLIDCHFAGRFGWAITKNNLLLITSDYGSSWKLMNIENVSQTDQVYGVNEKSIWIRSADKLLHTKDGGKIWNEYQIKVYNPRNIYALNDTLCYIGGDSEIGKSLDAGKTWEITKFTDYMEFYKFSFINSDTGWVCDYRQGKVFRTNNAGKDWIQLTSGNSHWMMVNIIFFNKNDGFIYDLYNANIHKTTDGGNNWEIIHLIKNYALFSIEFVDPNTIYYTGLETDIYKSTDSGRKWTSVFNKGIKSIHYKMHFFDKDTGVVIGTEVYRTVDGGKNWTLVLDKSVIGDKWGKIYKAVIDQNTLYIATYYNKLFKSIDKGLTWESLNIPTNSWYDVIEGMDFINKDTGYVIKADRLLKTTNGGIDWSQVTQLTINGVDNFRFINTQDGWCVVADKVLKTTDGGKTWVKKLYTENYELDFYSSFFLDENNGWVYQYSPPNYTMFITKDGGSSWGKIAVDLGRALTMYFIDKLLGYCSNEDGKIYFTKDGGYTWIKENHITGSLMRDFTIQPECGIWACGGFALLAKFDSNLVSVKEIEPEAVPTTFELKQNYPNPFNPSTTIEYSIPEAGIVTLKVYNVLGQEIKTLVNEYKPAGKHSELFTLRSSLSSGVYYCTLKSGKFTKSIKMILLK